VAVLFLRLLRLFYWSKTDDVHENDSEGIGAIDVDRPSRWRHEPLDVVAICRVAEFGFWPLVSPARKAPPRCRFPVFLKYRIAVLLQFLSEHLGCERHDFLGVTLNIGDREIRDDGCDSTASSRE